MPDGKIKILVTGFDAAGNASGDVVQHLRRTHPNVTLITQLLPVDFQKAQATLEQVMRVEKPDLVISIGEYAGQLKPGMRMETEAQSNSEELHNIENSMELPHGKATLLSSTFPMLTRAASTSYKKHFATKTGVATSYDAGTFVCEHTFYTALKEQAAAGNTGKAVFLHINNLSIGSVIPSIANGSQSMEAFFGAPGFGSIQEHPGLLRAYTVKHAATIKRYAAVVDELIDYVGTHPKEYAREHHYKRTVIPYTEFVATTALEEGLKKQAATQDSLAFDKVLHQWTPLGNLLPVEPVEKITPPLLPKVKAEIPPRGKN